MRKSTNSRFTEMCRGKRAHTAASQRCYELGLAYATQKEVAKKHVIPACKLFILEFTSPLHALLQQLFGQFRHPQSLIQGCHCTCGLSHLINAAPAAAATQCLKSDTRVHYCVLLLQFYGCWTKPKLLHNSVHFLDVIKVPANHGSCCSSNTMSQVRHNSSLLCVATAVLRLLGQTQAASQ